MESKPVALFGGRPIGKALDFGKIEKRAYALMAKQKGPQPKLTMLEDLVLSWQAEVDRRLSKIACNDKLIGNLSSSINGITGCSGNDSNTTRHYCDVAIAVVKNVVPRGKAWRKLYDLDRSNGYGF